jgi:replication factor C large subunit
MTKAEEELKQSKRIWADKHRPTYFSQIIGQDEAIERIREFIKNARYERKKALLLYGPPGVGKTTIALVAAKEMDAELFELNASDFRNKEKLDSVLKPVLEQKSLSKKNKLILIDEVDGITAFADRGGLPELLRLIELSKYPIIITANDAFKSNLSALRNKVELIAIKSPPPMETKDLLLKILEKEGKTVSEDFLIKVAIKSNGDIRAAINDIESLINVDEKELIEFSQRNKEISIFDALKLVLKGKPIEETMTIFDNVKEPLDEIILWLEKNVPVEYQQEELHRAFEKISRTDIFKSRITKQQYWRFMVYENFLLSYGISASKTKPKTGFSAYKKPTRILKIWMSNQKLAKKKSISEKYCKVAHIGLKRAMHDFNLIIPILQKPKVQKQLKLTEEEIDYLNKARLIEN